MAKTLNELRADYQDAEARAHDLANKADAQRRANAEKIAAAWADAAAKQKLLNDAEALEALQDRPDGEAVAEALGLS